MLWSLSIYDCIHICQVAAKQLLDPAVADGIGELMTASVMWCLRKPDGYYALEHRRQAGAGPITTNFSHDVDTLRHLCGELEAVMGMAANRLGRGGRCGLGTT